MNMSMIEILAFIALHFYGSVLPQLAHKRLTGQYRLPFKLRYVLALNLTFLTAYLWTMTNYIWGYYVIWVFTILGTVGSTISWYMIRSSAKRRTLEV